MDLLDLASAFLTSFIAAIIFMSAVFMIGRRLRRFDIVDASWGLVFIVVASTSLLVSDTVHTVQYVVLAMVLVWGLRLSRHIYRRFIVSSKEDQRYVVMRQKWQAGNENLAIYFRIYITQAVLATIICLPIIIINTASVEAPSVAVITGGIIWLAGFCIEALADRQLRSFISQPANKGQLMMGGLWRHSRHPNYFGELLLWWGVGIIALGVPLGWAGLIGPALISVLIIFVSGIPPTEKMFAGRPGWDDYKRRTSALIPWFVKKEAS